MAQPRVNPHTGGLEMAEGDWVLMYDVVLATYRFRPTGSAPTYDVVNDRIANVPAGAVQRFMPHDGTCHMALPDWVIEYDVTNGRYAFVPPRR